MWGILQEPWKGAIWSTEVCMLHSRCGGEFCPFRTVHVLVTALSCPQSLAMPLHQTTVITRTDLF